MSPFRSVVRLAAALAAACLVSSTPLAHAGQVRVSVGLGGLSFQPRAVNVNPGDHVCWVWTSGSHTVTSGDSSTSIPSNIFASSSVALSNQSYSWRATTGVIPYFCIPHVPNMAGRVIVADAGNILVPDFHITEVQFNAVGGLDLIELGNLGPVAGNLGKFRLAVNNATTAQPLVVSAFTNDLVVPSGGRVVIHLNAAGVSSTTDLFFPSVAELPSAGSVALYVPNQFVTSLAVADQMIDFVQWGAGAQALAATANTAGLWVTAQAITGVADGHSIEFCGQQNQHGISFWSEVSSPNFGSNGNCATPADRSTWGRIKTLYR